MPDFKLEKAVEGLVCGLDEVGRAPLAGPVVAACVHIPENSYGMDLWPQINDSKKLSKAKREGLFDQIKKHSIWAIAEASAREVETLNIVQASFLAMQRAFEQCSFENNFALIDGHITPPNFPCSVQTVIKGDSKSVSIAAASILAKVYRDRLMCTLAEKHPHYGWDRNAGYPTPEHLEAVNKYGITPHHRKTFAPVQNYIEFGTVQRQMKMAL